MAMTTARRIEWRLTNGIAQSNVASIGRIRGCGLAAPPGPSTDVKEDETPDRESCGNEEARNGESTR